MDAPVPDSLLADCGAMLEQDFKEAHQHLNIVSAAVLLGRLVLDFDILGPTQSIVKHRKAWRTALQLRPLA